MKKQIIVISLGGSLIFPNGGIDTKFLKQFRSLITRYVRKGYRFAIITGGGTIARQYQDALRRAGIASPFQRDWIAIQLTRVNAHLLRILFGGPAHDLVLTKPAQARSALFLGKKIIFMGGEKPGQTTDCVAVKCAIGVGACMILNLSNVDYIYDRDPKKYRGVKLFHTLSWVEFQKLFPRRHMPGSNAPFDPIATALAKKYELTVAFLGATLSNVKNFLDGKSFKGTLVFP